MATLMRCCKNCDFGKLLHLNLQKLCEERDAAKKKLADLKEREKLWFSFVSEWDIWIAEHDVAHAEGKINRYNNNRRCERFPEFVEKKNEDSCGEFKLNAGIDQALFEAGVYQR